MTDYPYAPTAAQTRAPVIGYWWCICCEHDLHEITTEDDIQVIQNERAMSDAYGGMPPQVWETKEAALAELKVTEEAFQKIVERRGY